MTLTPDEARGILADIDAVAKRMRNTLAASALGPNLMIWGLVWAAGFSGSYFSPQRPGMIWGSLLTAGALASICIGAGDEHVGHQ